MDAGFIVLSSSDHKWKMVLLAALEDIFVICLILNVCSPNPLGLWSLLSCIKPVQWILRAVKIAGKRSDSVYTALFSELMSYLMWFWWAAWLLFTLPVLIAPNQVSKEVQTFKFVFCQYWNACAIMGGVVLSILAKQNFKGYGISWVWQCRFYSLGGRKDQFIPWIKDLSSSWCHLTI